MVAGDADEASEKDSQPPGQLSRIEAARAGHLPLHALTHDELAAFNASVDDAIERRLATIDWQGELSRRGLYSVALDDDGRIVVRPPDGSCSGDGFIQAWDEQTDGDV